MRLNIRRHASRVLSAILWVAAPAAAPVERPYRVDYDGFTVWLDCQRHGAVKFRYNAQHDTGNESRAKGFSLDSGVPRNCQPRSTEVFRALGATTLFDRGHLVPANHMDGSVRAIAQTNYMTNILPQTATLNRGAWLTTEEIVECYRDIDELLVIGGVVWGSNRANDFFVESHGIETPDAFWKVVIRGNGDAIAWLIPNDETATRKNLDRFLISVADLEHAIQENIPEVSGDARLIRPERSWMIPVGCNKG